MGSEHLKKAAARVRKLAEAQELGKQEGDYKGQKKKSFEVSLKEHIGKFIDKITLDNTLELGAVVSVAIILHGTNDFLSRGVVYYNKIPVGAGFAGYAPWGIEGIKKSDMPQDVSDMVKEWLICFGMAYLIVHNFGLIVQTTGNIAKSLGNLGLALLG